MQGGYSSNGDTNRYCGGVGGGDVVNDGGVAGVFCGRHYSVRDRVMEEFIQQYNYIVYLYICRRYN